MTRSSIGLSAIFLLPVLLCGPSTVTLALCLVAAVLPFARPSPARAEGVVDEVLSADAQSILDVLPDACVLLDAGGMVLWANAAAREQFGIFSAGNPFSFTMRVPELIHTVEKVSRSGLSDRARWSEKVPTSRWYEAFIAPFALAGAGPRRKSGVAIFVRDLTQQERLDRMREDFVANASHELRTPLAALTGFIETLQGPAKDDARAREQFLGIMHEQAVRMKRLTDALLSLSRIEMRVHVRPAELVDFVGAVRAAVELTRPLARSAEVALELEVDEEPLLVRGDSDELVQLVGNLIENATKYGGDGGRVVIHVRREAVATGFAASVSVQDFGRGIAPEHVPRLTERFYRVDVEASRARQGTGLGLAIVKHTVARHRGRLTVRSELGAGSTFSVKIPLETEKKASNSGLAPIPD